MELPGVVSIPPHQKHPLLCQVHPLKSENCPSAPFYAIPPIYWFFVQGRIQTTSTYASAEVTSAVVKLLKNYRNTRFLLQIMLFFSSANQKDWNLFGQGMSWLFCKICRMSLHACHAVKTVFLEISENSVRFKKIFKNALIIPHVCFSNACRIQQNTQAEQITGYVVQQLFLTLHRWNICLSNSNYFTSAKKCRLESSIIDFMSAKMEIPSAIFKKLYFPKHSIKRCCK